jgi:hypothetical protein
VPFLRVIRDKRGYETTYLMHWFREGSRQESRIIYAFRSPGGVRVGRVPLEPDVLRQIEARHPEIDFDWSAVLDNKQVIESAPEQRRPRKRRRDEEPAKPAPDAAAAAPRQPAPPPPAPRFVVPAQVVGDTPDAQIAFLAEWYSAIREQVEQRVHDPSRRDALLALCERLNSASWTDADQITAGLPPAAEALERLSHVFAKRRRRSRKKKGPDDRQPNSPETREPDSIDTQELDSTDTRQVDSTDPRQSDSTNTSTQ